MEVAVIFSTNSRAVSDGTCVLNKTGRRTDVMFSGICCGVLSLSCSLSLPGLLAAIGISFVLVQGFFLFHAENYSENLEKAALMPWA